MPYNTSEYCADLTVRFLLVRTEELPGPGGATGGLCGSDDLTAHFAEEKTSLMSERCRKCCVVFGLSGESEWDEALLLAVKARQNASMGPVVRRVALEQGEDTS